MKVCIDAGHYAKYNRSPGIAGYYESEVMWKLSQLQKKYLEQLGIEVVMTRLDQTKDLALVERGKKATGCDLFISNHSNAVGSVMNENIDYVAVYHLFNDVNTEVDDISTEMALKLAPVISKTMGVNQNYKVLPRKDNTDRNKDGIMNDNYYGVLHGARLVNVPGLIIEHSFHTNTRTVNWLLDDNNLDKLARATAECIASYLFNKEVSLDKKGEKAVTFEEIVAAMEKLGYTNYTKTESGVNFTKPSVFRKGDKVKVLKNLTYDGKSFRTWHKTYTVMEEPKGGRVVIGVGKVTTCAINAKNIRKV